MAAVQSTARSEVPDQQIVALRLPPHSVEAEQSLLGALLLDNQEEEHEGLLLGGGGAGLDT
jgi:hypothetical protein